MSADLVAGIRRLLDAYEAQERYPYGPPVLPTDEVGAKRACIYICEGDIPRGQALWEAIKELGGGYVPAAAAIALIHAGFGANRDPHIETPEST